MNIEKARELITHRLNDELTEEETRELNEYITDHPEFKEEIEMLEATWNNLDLLVEGVAAPSMGAELEKELGVRNLGNGADWGSLRYWAIAAVLLLGLLILFGLGGGPNAPINPNFNEAGPDKPNQQAANPNSKSPIPVSSSYVLRVRGLLLLKGETDNRWHLLQRGDHIQEGESIRIPANSGFGAIVQGPDGSTLALRSGTHIQFVGARSWSLLEGAVYATVVKSKDEMKFTIKTKEGEAVALGTEFILATGVGEFAGKTICEVDEGAVRLGGKVIEKGKFGLLSKDGVTVDAAKTGTRDWLLQTQALLEADESVAQLIASTQEAGKRLPLEIHGYDVDVTVVDGVARTFIDMTFFNHTDRRLEGTFFYTVPGGATISEFAMYVGTTRIVGEVLEQQSARQIFEYIRREQRDPAMLEWAGGNLFKMRVYPIEPNSEKRIQLGYTQVLPRRDGKLSYTFPLVSEMLKKNPLRTLSMGVKILSSANILDLECPTHRTEIGMAENRSRGTVAFSSKNYTPANDFNVTWGVPESNEFLVLTNKRPDDEEGYFLAQISPTVFAGDRKPPERLLIVVDGSGSVDPQSFSVAREFAAAAAEMVEGWQFNVALSGYDTFFLDEDFQVAKPGDARRVYKFLDQRKPLGGTDLLKTFEAISAKLPSEGNTHIVYVGDGVNTLGKEEGAGLVKAIVAALQDIPSEVSCVSIGSSYDRLVLEGLANQKGGTFRAVEGVDNVFLAAESILSNFSRPVYRSVQVKFEGVTAGGLYPESLGTVSEGETAIVLGRIVKGGKGKAIVSGIAEGQPFKKEYPLDLEGNSEQNHFVPRLWATAHMDSLRARMGISSTEADAYLRDQVIATSLNYQIMSPFTAFLCLESEEDYKRFGIVRRRRMLDWKGELEGVTNSSPDIVARTKPKKPKPDLKQVRIPTPPISFVPQEIFEEAQALMQVEKQFQESAQQWGGSGGGGGTIYTSSLSSTLMATSSRSEIWHENRRSGNLQLYNVRDLLSSIPDYGGMGLPSSDDDEGGNLFGNGESKELNGRESRLDFLGEDALSELEKNVETGGEFEYGENEIDSLKLIGAWSGESESPRRTKSEEKPQSEKFFGDRLGRSSEMSSSDSRSFDIDLQFSAGRMKGPKSAGDYFSLDLEDLDIDSRMLGKLEMAGGFAFAKESRGRGSYGYSTQLYPQSYLRRNNVQTINLEGGKTLVVRWDAADEVYLQRSLLANPDSLQTRLDLALSLASRHRLGAARRVFEPMLDVAKNSALWLEFAWFDYHLGDHGQSKASVLKAIPLAADATQRQHCGYELATLGAFTEATEYFLELAEAEKDPSQALNYYGQAYNYANSSTELKATAHEVWDKALKRFSTSTDCLARAANALQNTQPELALQYIARHENLIETARLDPAPAHLTSTKLNALFQLGRHDEAWKVLEEQARTANDHNTVYQALYTAYNRDHRRAYKLVNEILNDEKRYPIPGPQVHGAVRFHQSYKGTFESQKRLNELGQRDDLPGELRTAIFYSLHRNGGRNREWTAVMLPLFKKLDTEADLAAAIGGAQALISYGYHTEATQFMDAMANSKALNKVHQKQIELMRWQILANSGDMEKASKHLEETFDKIKDPQHAYNLLSQSIYPLINHDKAELCIKLHAEMFKRFPSYANNRYLHQNLINQLRNRGQLDLLRKHQESLRQENETKLAKELLPDWEKIVELAKAKEFGTAFKALEKFQGALSERKAVMMKEMESLRDLIKQSLPKEIKEGKVPEETQKRLEELHENHARLLREYDACIGLMEVAFRLRIKLAATDQKLAAMFLKECEVKAGNEDPRTREWTQAKLLCLALSDKQETYHETLEGLYKAEPQDPVWPRLLLNARFAAGDADGGTELLDKFCKQDPYDVRLAYTWHGLKKLTGTEEEIAAARDQYFRALAIMPNVLQQLANRWQNQKKIDLAVSAWLAMQRSPAYANNGWPMYQAASVLQGTEDKERTVSLYFDIFRNKNYASTYGQGSLSQLRSMMNDEAALLHIEKRVPELTEAKEIWIRNCGAILAAHIAQLRKQDLKPHLENLYKISEKDLQNVTASLMDFFVEAKAFDRMYEYVVFQMEILPGHQKQIVIQAAVSRLIPNSRTDQKVRQIVEKLITLTRSDELQVTVDERFNMLRNIASSLSSYNETRPLATQIYRELIEQQSPNASNILYQLVQWLVNDNQVVVAQKLLEENHSYHADWNLWYAHDLVIQHVGHTQKNYVLAARIAYEAWKKWDRQLQNYGQNVFNRFTEMSWLAMRNRGLPTDLKDALQEEILRLGEGHFQEGNSNTYNQGNLWNCVEQLGMAGSVTKMAEAAVASDHPLRVFNGAQFASYASNYRQDLFDLADRGYRKLLGMNIADNQKQQAYSQLYALYTNNHFKRWESALEVLEPWKAAGNLQEETFLYNRGFCLYKLRRNKEGRVAVLELLKHPNYRRYYWNAETVASWCREAEDYITEVECLEHGMRWMRYLGQLQPSYVSQFYTAMGNAYRNMGETEKSYEAFLRGMSLLNRNRNDWYYRNLTDNLIKVLKEDAKGGGLDDMVAYYEKNMLKGGEMPHMRITFGDAYEKAGKNLQSLQQYSIAADLMPKDTTLREKVINGFIKEGRQDLAESEYLSWIKLDPQNVQIYKQLGQLYEKTDRYRLAMDAFTSMPEARPREAEGHQEFAKILISKNRHQEAVAPYEKAVNYRPTLFSIADEYAKLQAGLGADGKKLHQIFATGEEACRRAIEVLEDDPLPWLNLARFLKAQERKGEARTLLDEILKRRWPRFARETRDEAMKIQQEL